MWGLVSPYVPLFMYKPPTDEEIRVSILKARYDYKVMMPDQANPSGYIHGGELIKMIDNAAGVVAARHCKADIVLARVADVSFLAPVEVGNLVLIHAYLTFVSRASMEVRIDLEAESLMSGDRWLANTAYLIMVSIDDDGKPREVPPLLISTEKQQQLFDEGKARYDAYKKSKTKKK